MRRSPVDGDGHERVRCADPRTAPQLPRRQRRRRPGLPRRRLVLPLHRRCPSAATTPDWHVHTPRHSSNAPTPCFFVIDDIDPRKTWYHPGTCLIPPTQSAIKRCAQGIRTPIATRIFTPSSTCTISLSRRQHTRACWRVHPKNLARVFGCLWQVLCEGFGTILTLTTLAIA